MKAAVVTAPAKIQILEVPKPKLSPENIIIKVQTASICNATDYKLFTAAEPTAIWPFKKHPFILGHECFGEIVEVGSSVLGLTVKDKVVFWTIPGGGFAEYVSIPVREAAIGKVDDRISAFVAPIMEMVIGCARYLFNSDGTTIARKGDKVVIYGLGPAGLIFTQLAKALGAGTIVAIGRRKLRLERASSLGASEVLDEQKIDVIEKITKLIGAADIVVDATGSDILSDILALSHPGMFFIPYGVPPFKWEDKLTQFSKKGVIFRNAGLGEAKVASKYCIDWVSRGKVLLEPLVTHRIPLEKVEMGLNLCHSHRDSTLKVILEITPR